MNSYWIPVWKKAPFIRLLLPLITGILLQWYLQFEFYQILMAAVCFTIAFTAFKFFPLALRFNLQPLQGFLINILLVVFGLFIAYQKDIRHNENWFGNIYHDSDYIVATINEPLLEKNKSYKAEAVVNNILENGSVKNTEGKIILYFEKDSANLTALRYGDKIIINKPLQDIKNSGNPGSFNYRRYLAFRRIFHTVFLKKNDWVLLKEKDAGQFNNFIFSTREKVVNILQKNISGENEKAIAEALLIGYKADLDKDLVQAYSNTGVVHIIAISGLHLGIYILLLWILNKIPFVKKADILKFILLLIGIWLFAVLTGAAPSVLRAAVMFSCIILGKALGKKSSIYNSLAASAFLLLCINPYLLWEVGFQLSYLAVIGIVVFQMPIYQWLYVKNKFLNKIWKLISVAIAAQLLTFPACLYYFHQFPLLFFITNLIVVPLASIILYSELILIAVSPISIAAFYAGKITGALLWLMNASVLFINHLSFALWDMISSSIVSTLFLYGTILSAGYWLLNKSKTAFKAALLFFTLFMIVIVADRSKSSSQQKLIVYNVPQHQSIDFINGNSYKFVGDSIMLVDGMLQNFHLKPARIALQLKRKLDTLSNLFQQNNFYQFNNKKIVVIDTTAAFVPLQQKINVDYIIISKNPKLYISQLAKVFNCSQFIFDGSNSLWKIANWKKDCEQLHLRCYSVPEQGAFVVDL